MTDLLVTWNLEQTRLDCLSGLDDWPDATEMSGAEEAIGFTALVSRGGLIDHTWLGHTRK